MDYNFSDTLAKMTGSATRDIFKLLNSPAIVSFAGGLPAGDALPVKIAGEITAEIFSDAELARKCLQYGQTEGFPGFREVIAESVLDLNIRKLCPDELLVTSGGGQVADLALKAFVNPGDAVLVENPTFLGFIQTALSYNANLVGVRGEADGIDLDDLEDKLKKFSPKLVYLIPTFSNPTGKTYPLEKRRAVLKLAHRYGAVILEDDPYGRLRFSGDFVPPLFALDDGGAVIYCSSFSKTISPGLRVGFAAGGPAVIRKLTIGKQGTDLHTPILSQLIVKKYLEKGYLLPGVEKSLPLYRERRDAMLGALGAYMPDNFKFTRPDGGLFVWGEFPEGTDTSEYFMKAIERNAAFIRGDVFYADGGGRNTLRLNFSNEPPERIEKGVRALGEVFAP